MRRLHPIDRLADYSALRRNIAVISTLSEEILRLANHARSDNALGRFGNSFPVALADGTLAEQLPPQEELNDLAPPVVTEQRAVREGTAGVLSSITLQQDTLRQILTQAYGDIGRPHATEVDPVVDLLAGTMAAQDQALASLAPKAVRWPRANTALHTAAGQMQQALDALRSLQPPTTDEQDDTVASRNVGDYDENMDGLESESQPGRSQPASPAWSSIRQYSAMFRSVVESLGRR